MTNNKCSCSHFLIFLPLFLSYRWSFTPKNVNAQVCLTEAFVCSVQSVELCEFLLQHGANVNAQVRTVGTSTPLVSGFFTRFFCFYKWLYSVYTFRSVALWMFPVFLLLFKSLFRIRNCRIRNFFGPPGSGFFHHQSKVVRKAFISTVLRLFYDFLSLNNNVTVPSKTLQFFPPINCLSSAGPLPYLVKRISAWLIVSRRV